ncbi:MAG: hypothetical protein PUG48_09065 [Clostridia bacterium]|nr:hypothetical protein [Clostridia bacterium]
MAKKNLFDGQEIDFATILKEYKSSDFYKKYQNQYFSDSILKEVFGVELTKHRFYTKNYDFVYNKNVEVMSDFINGYAEKAKCVDDHIKWLMLYSIYLDPDNSSIVSHGGIECTADGLLSLTRMYNKFGVSLALVEEYRKYRKTPIIHFPRESGGINMSRSSVFGDRIDHTLYDLKRLCDGKNDCKLKSAYSLPKTSQWLQSFDYDFSQIVEWLGIYGIFVNENYEVFDLEKDDGSTIHEYCKQYNWAWSEQYYEHLKAKIEEYERKQNGGWVK